MTVAWLPQRKPGKARRDMRLGISSYSYGWAAQSPHGPITPLGLLDRACRYGIGLVQICDNMPLHALAPGALALLKKTARDKKIDLEVGTRRLTDQNLETYTGIASELGSPLLRMVIDDTDYHPSREDISAVLRNAIPALKKQRIVLALENHDRFKACELGAIVEDCASEWVGICLDSVNSIGAAEGIETVVECLAQHTVNLHLKDFTIRRLPYLMGFTVEGSIAGKGMLNIPWLVGKVSHYRSAISAILELWTPPEDEMEDTLQKEEQWVRDSITTLRGFHLFEEATTRKGENQA